MNYFPIASGTTFIRNLIEKQYVDKTLLIVISCWMVILLIIVVILIAIKNKKVE